MTPQQKNLQQAIDQAWLDYNRLFAYEISTDYEDAMDMAERREAEGFASGLSVAHFMIYGDHYLTTVEPCDEDNYEKWMDK